jgi:Cu/Ag efflux pump CusA
MSIRIILENLAESYPTDNTQNVHEALSEIKAEILKGLPDKIEVSDKIFYERNRLLDEVIKSVEEAFV